MPTSGEYDVATLTTLAREVESLGYDGLFLWDNILTTFDDSGVLADSTVALTAVVLATRRIRCGLLCTPLPRRRPWKVAKETATLDRLSGGRLVVGVGLGGVWDFAPFHEAPSGPDRAQMPDEGLEVLTACWRGEDVHYEGRHYIVEGARLRPTPVQRPRIPIWTAGYWPGTAPFRRAAAWDGVAPLRQGHDFAGLTPSELVDCLAYIRRFRPEPLDAVYFHTGDVPANPAEYAEAGATWWLESTNPARESLAEFRDRLRAGPPTV